MLRKGVCNLKKMQSVSPEEAYQIRLTNLSLSWTMATMRIDRRRLLARQL